MTDLVAIVLECKNKELVDKIADTLYLEYGILHVCKNLLNDMYTTYKNDILFKEHSKVILDKHIEKIKSVKHKTIVINTEDTFTSEYLDIFKTIGEEVHIIDSEDKLYSDIIEEIELILL